jgi:hypothetical protein
MARSGQRKQQKQEIESIVAEILIDDPSSSFRDVDFKLRSDPLWSNRLNGIQKLPSIGTIKNYVSAMRTKLRNSGSDRPWSILASADSQDVNYVAATDLPLILKIWRIRLALGSHLTLRQARWITRLRSLELWDLATDAGLSSIFETAAKYAGRQAALGGQADSDSNNDSPESHDLDGRLAFERHYGGWDDLDDNYERNGLRVTYQALMEVGTLNINSLDPSVKHEHLRGTEESATISAQLGTMSAKIGADFNRVLHRMSLHKRSGLFSVMRVLFQRPEWETMELESKVSLVERIVEAVEIEDWKTVADLAEMKVVYVNQSASDHWEGLWND